MHGGCPERYIQHSYPVQDPVSAVTMGLIPVDFEMEGLHETQSGKRKTNERGKIISSHVLSVCNGCRSSSEDN